ncbi:hypothetical protein V2G26_016064 [Clonostachys chloroleuca]
MASASTSERSRSRSRSRSKPRSVAKKASFRDELQLVAVRYEKTSQGDLPIPITSRNSRPSSSSRPATASRPTSASSSASYGGPIVVIPPIPPIAPPTEEHPALRASGPVLTQRVTPVERKRDSGHATSSASSSTPTINEEDIENDCGAEYLSTTPPLRTMSPAMLSIQESVEEDDEEGLCTPTASFEMRLSEEVDMRPRAPVARSSFSGSERTERMIAPASPRRPHTRCAEVPVMPKPEAFVVRPKTSTAADKSLSLPKTKKSPKKKQMGRSFSFLSTASSWLHQDQDQEVLVSEPEQAQKPHPVREMRPAHAWGTTGTGTGTGSGPGSGKPAHPPLRRCPASPEAPGSMNSQPPSVPLAPPSRRPAASAVTSLFKRAAFSTKPKAHSKRGPDPDLETFTPLTVAIPSSSLLDDGFMTGLTFSNRGSVMFGGHRALGFDGLIMDHHDSYPRASTESGTGVDNGKRATPPPSLTAAPKPITISIDRPSSAATDATPETGYMTPDAASKSQPTHESLDVPSSTPNIQVLDAEVELESRKVRSLYANGGAPGQESLDDRRSPLIEEHSAEESDRDSLAQLPSTPRRADSLLKPDGSKSDGRRAGALEDWDDLEGAHIDRYGFISIPRPDSSRHSSTELKAAQLSPRRRTLLHRKDGGSLSSSGGKPFPSRKMSARSLNTYHSGLSATSLRSSRSVIRQASNMLPQNRDRRVVDGASEMLTPGLHDIADEVRAEKISEALKRKEWERSEKWRKMAKNVRKGARGEGTEFEFDVKNPKLIERTWKGIPDRWRAAAWWSFLASSAQNDTESPSEEDIIKAFHELQDRSSPDDVQIDLDVPRTVSLHIMFRRRYEGGQRLLFRVLHALSIYFPETGYVQGMASLGATLLCYFDEEKSFVMLVRMWQLRGLERLYRHGFEGLMTALNEFETIWLHKDVAKKLSELGIEATAYGTRWYLTLFNLSLPFPAQLRVWDVFLLLGDSGSNPVEAKPQNKKSAATPIGPPTGLGILHATSAAIVQALREVLLDSDFENAMKSLTSFVSIQDEDLLMKVSKAEWKSHKGKRKA